MNAQPAPESATAKNTSAYQRDGLSLSRSIRVVLRDSDHFVGGDSQLPSIAPGTCASRDIKGSTLRACREPPCRRWKGASPVREERAPLWGLARSGGGGGCCRHREPT